MPVWGWILIAVAAVVVCTVVGWQVVAQQRTKRLKGRFGPEYDRTVNSSSSKSEAEAELAAREERREKLQIRPLSSEARDRYLEQWQAVQAQFVDDPAGAVTRADGLIQSAMSDRGYPMEDFEQRAADVSVDHPEVVDHYRQGHRLFEQSAGGGDTEALRQAMRHYRALFERLVDDQPAGQPPAGEQTTDTTDRRERVTQS